ncbi:MAG: hypothetical protein ACRD4G_10370, partial [Bryobacteraceae bacterium]
EEKQAKNTSSPNVSLRKDQHRKKLNSQTSPFLSRTLFVPPPGLKRVAWLEGGMRYRFPCRLRLRWEFFKLSFTLSRRIANYLR